MQVSQILGCLQQVSELILPLWTTLVKSRYTHTHPWKSVSSTPCLLSSAITQPTPALLSMHLIPFCLHLLKSPYQPSLLHPFPFFQSEVSHVGETVASVQSVPPAAIPPSHYQVLLLPVPGIVGQGLSVAADKSKKAVTGRFCVWRDPN